MDLILSQTKSDLEESFHVEKVTMMCLHCFGFQVKFLYIVGSVVIIWTWMVFHPARTRLFGHSRVRSRNQQTASFI